jgi:putative PIN family toxin of toxin-antitoxin system
LRSDPQRPRIIVDPNIWLSYLLPSRPVNRTVDRLMAMIESDRVILVVPMKPIRELRQTVAQKPYLAQRIAPEQFDVVIEFLQSIGEMVPEQEAGIPRPTRDPKDDYLLAAAVTGDLDILVSGNADLLSLRQHLDRPHIMTVKELVDAFASE